MVCFTWQIQEIVDASHLSRLASGGDTPPKPRPAETTQSSLGVPLPDGVHFTFSPGSEETKQLSSTVNKETKTAASEGVDLSE